MNAEPETMQRADRWVRAVPVLTGVLIMLLLPRLVAQLLASRPDNLVFQVLYAVTDPLVWPLRFLDAQQPRFGAVLELSALAAVPLLSVLGYGIWWMGVRTKSDGTGRQD